MELFKEILIKALANEDVSVTFPNLTLSAEELVELKCYYTLQKIKVVLENDSFDDAECFEQIGIIVRILEDVGCPVDGRHDFG